MLQPIPPAPAALMSAEPSQRLQTWSERAEAWLLKAEQLLQKSAPKP